MAQNECNEIPVISITSEDVAFVPSNICNKLPLTDIEDLDSDNESSKKTFTLKEVLNNDLDLTDSEYIHTSDEEDIPQFRPVTPALASHSNDSITTDECVRVICRENPTKTQFNSFSKQSEDFLGLQPFEEDGLTDFEDIEGSDGEIPTVPEIDHESAAYYNEQDTVTITHKVNVDIQKINLCRRNAVFRSPHVQSENDSSEDNIESLDVRCLGGITDTEELDIPGTGKILDGSTNDNAKPKYIRIRKCSNKEIKDSKPNKNYLSPNLAKTKTNKKITSKNINVQKQESLKVDENDDPITDVEDIYFGSVEKISKTKLKTRKKTPALKNKDDNLDTSEEEDNSNSTVQWATQNEQNLLAPNLLDDGGVTDVENVSSLDSEEENESDLPLPDAVRQKVLVRENSGEQPNTIKTIPLEDSEPLGLYVARSDDSCVTDMENYTDEDDDNPTIISSPQEVEISELDDYGTIETSEVFRTDDIKTERSFICVMDPTTDTEEISMSSGLRRRRKPKPKCNTGAKPKSYLNVIGAKPMPCLNVTDTEEIGFSDNEKSIQIKQLAVKGDATDVEDFEISDDELEIYRQAASRTPEFMRSMEYASTRTTERDKSMPYSKINVCSIPEIRMLSASPDINHATHTDTEDIFGSGEEDLTSSYSRAETVTPLEMDENVQSTVSIVHTRKFDIDAPEEAIHVKGHLEDTHTDFEELEEPWGEASGNVSKDEEFCVCAASPACVCKKPHKKNTWSFENAGSKDTERSDDTHRDTTAEQQGSGDFDF